MSFAVSSASPTATPSGGATVDAAAPPAFTADAAARSLPPATLATFATLDVIQAMVAIGTDPRLVDRVADEVAHLEVTTLAPLRASGVPAVQCMAVQRQLRASKGAPSAPPRDVGGVAADACVDVLDVLRALSFDSTVLEHFADRFCCVEFVTYGEVRDIGVSGKDVISIRRRLDEMTAAAAAASPAAAAAAATPFVILTGGGGGSGGGRPNPASDSKMEPATASPSTTGARFAVNERVTAQVSWAGTLPSS